MKGGGIYSFAVCVFQIVDNLQYLARSCSSRSIYLCTTESQSRPVGITAKRKYVTSFQMVLLISIGVYADSGCGHWICDLDGINGVHQYVFKVSKEECFQLIITGKV